MAIQFPNFLGHGEQTPDYSPVSNLLGNILRGYQIVKSPAQMERQAQSEELANALKQLQLQHAPTKMSLEEELLRAQIEKARKPYQLTPTGDIRNQIYIKQLEKTNPELANQLSQAIKQKQEMENKKIENQQQYVNSIGWRSMPSSEKQRSLALAAGMEKDPVYASQYFSKGKTLEDMAIEEGYTLNEVNANYAPTTPNITAMQRRKAFDAEMKTLNERIKEGMSPYAQKVAGMSFEQIIDQLDSLSEGADKDTKKKLGKFLAARALAPEMAGLRLNTMGGRVGIEAIRDLEAKSESNAKLVLPIDSEIYNYMQDYMQQYIEEAVKSYASVIDEMGKIKTPAPVIQEFDAPGQTPTQFDFSAFPVFQGGK